MRGKLTRIHNKLWISLMEAIAFKTPLGRFSVVRGYLEEATFGSRGVKGQSCAERGDYRPNWP